MSFIAKKLALARQQLQSARNNIERNDVETAANRGFLAAENAAAAAIAKSGRYAKPLHSQVRTNFEDLCDRGIIPQRFGSLLTESYGLRLRGNYGRRMLGGQIIPGLTQKTVQAIIDGVADLIDAVSKMPTRPARTLRRRAR